MFDKIEFSDIYKFISSIGLILIAIAFAIPYLIFQINISELLANIDLLKCSDDLQKIIILQQNTLLFFMRNWWIASVTSFISGIVLLIMGLFYWNKRQKVFDNMQDMELIEKQQKIKIADANEINQKNEEDAEEVVNKPEDKKVFIDKYSKIESNVINYFKTNIKNKNIEVLENVKVASIVYDLVLIKKISSIQRIHKICEIKYYDELTSYQSVYNGVTNFMVSILNYKQNIINNDNRMLIESYMIWVIGGTVAPELFDEYGAKIMKIAQNKGLNISIVICRINELAELKKVLVDKHLTTAST